MAVSTPQSTAYLRARRSQLPKKKVRKNIREKKFINIMLLVVYFAFISAQALAGDTHREVPYCNVVLS